MTRIIIPNQADKSHLASVTEQMAILGTPTIKAVWVEAYGSWVAVEGSHRVLAAKSLGLTPDIEEIEYDADADLSVIGPDLENFGDTLGEFVDSACNRRVVAFN